MATNEVQQTLVDARRVLVEVGWCQGDYKKTMNDLPCAYCASGALMVSARPNESYREAANTLRAVIGFPSIELWNDDPRRTKDEVVAAFDLAIEMTREPKQ